MSKEKNPDHERIWLEPRPPTGVFEDRSWCQDDVWTVDLDYEGDPPTEYVRADLATQKGDGVTETTISVTFQSAPGPLPIIVTTERANGDCDRRRLSLDEAEKLSSSLAEAVRQARRSADYRASHNGRMAPWLKEAQGG